MLKIKFRDRYIHIYKYNVRKRKKYGWGISWVSRQTLNSNVTKMKDCRFLPIYYFSTPFPPKRIKICKSSPAHTSDGTTPNTLPDNPRTTPRRDRKMNPKNLGTLTPILKIRFPIPKDIWGVNKFIFENRYVSRLIFFNII